MQRKNLIGNYLTMVDDKGHKHQYRMTPQEAMQESWKGFYMESMRTPFYKFSEIISDESARNLWKAVR